MVETTKIEAEGVTEEPKKMMDWEVVLNLFDPNCFSYGADKTKGRPRRCSLHMLASVTGRPPEVIAKEMEESGLVLGYGCPDVGGALIFYLKKLRKIPGMIDTATDKVWSMVPETLKSYPFPEVQGFRRFPKRGEGYGMPVPFVGKEDRAYALLIKQALEENGFESSQVFIPSEE